jgi:hypothetical protein
MRRTLSLLLLLLFCLSGPALFAQEEPPEADSPESPPFESDWSDFETTVYAKGDMTFTISLGLIIPTFFSGVDDKGHGLKLGGTGSLAFNYFFTPRFFVGGELAGMFSGTRGGNMLYIIPFGVRVGYQFVFRRFEFPLSLMIGAAPQKYIEQGYFGLIVKPGVSAFWRFNPDWTFGVNTNWWFVPQWPKNGYNAYGNFLEVTVAARYNF